MRATRTGIVLLAILLAAAQTVQAGRVAVEVTASGEQFLVVNTSDKPVTPRLIVRGWTDRDGFPPRHASGLRMDGVPVLPARMLTGATWILEPDGSARWGYRTGTWSRAEGAPPDPRLWVFDPDKMSLDHWPPLPNYGGAMLWVASGGAPRAWSCRIEFPANPLVKRFCIAGNYEQCSSGKNATAVARVFADPEMKSLVAERAVDSATGRIEFVGTPALPNLFYLQITAKDIHTRNPIGLYWVDLWAELDAVGLPRLTLQPGVNALTAEDAEDSSHRWRILLEDKAIRDNPPRPKPEPLPDFVKNHRSRFRDRPAPAQKLATPAGVFPLGFYDGLPPGHLDFGVDDMVDMNCNVVHGSNMGPDNLGAVLDLLERAGLKLIYQGGGSGALYYQHKGYFGNDVKQEVEFNEANFKPSARKQVPLYRNRPGLLGWSIAEEVPPDVPERMTSYYALMRELDPTHAPVFLHNNFQAAKNDLERNYPAAITHDQYAFSLDPRTTGPTNLSQSVGAVLGTTRVYRELCDAHDVPFWFMGQCFAEPSSEGYSGPPYGLSGGARRLSPAVIRMQGWAAIAEGARGVFFFLYQGDGCCRDRYWRQTEQWHGVQTLFGEVTRLTPLLLRLKRDDGRDVSVKAKDSDAPLVIRVFTRRDQPATATKGLYAVVLNRSDTVQVPLALDGEIVQQAEIVWDVKRGKAAADTILDPGEGTLLWIGSKDQVVADRTLLETVRGK